jgi:hypothetical protein
MRLELHRHRKVFGMLNRFGTLRNVDSKEFDVEKKLNSDCRAMRPVLEGGKDALAGRTKSSRDMSL